MEDIEAHFQEEHFKKFAEDLQQHLAGPNALSIGKYHSVS
jgi:quinol monooxygenase YgiN